MAYPPFFARLLSYRQRESQGLPIDTSSMDAEFNDIAEILTQVVRWLMGITTSDGRLKNLAAATAQALSGAQRFVAVALQTNFDTTIVWDSAFSNLNVDLFVNGVRQDPSVLTVSNNAGNLRVTRSGPTPLAGGEICVVSAYVSGAGILSRLASTSSASDGASMIGLFDVDNLYAADDTEAALREIRLLFDQFVSAIMTASGSAQFTATSGQTTFVCNVAPGDIPWDNSLSTRNVFVYRGSPGVLMDPADYSVSDNGSGWLQVTGVTPAATAGEAFTVASYSLADLWTGQGVDLAGRGAQADFNLGGKKVTNMADGVAMTDAATIQQVTALASALSAAATVFLRTDGLNQPVADIDWGGFQLKDLGNATDPNDAVAFQQLTAALGDYLKLDGSTPMTGDLAMGGNSITGVAPGAASGEVVIWDQVILNDGTGVAPTADIPWGGKKLTNLAAPTAAGDATNKAYVDAIAGGASFGIKSATLPQGTTTLNRTTLNASRATKLLVSLAAPGAGGGGSAYGSGVGNGGGGGGGGSGAWAHLVFDLTLIPTWETIEIVNAVQGGNGLGTAGNGQPGGDGGDSTITIRDAASTILFKATLGGGKGGGGGLVAGTPKAAGGAGGVFTINTAHVSLVNSSSGNGYAGGDGGRSAAGGGPDGGSPGAGPQPGLGGANTGGSNAGGGGGGGSGPDAGQASPPAAFLFQNPMFMTGTGGEGGEAVGGTGEMGAQGTGPGSGGGGAANGTNSSYNGAAGRPGAALYSLQ